MSVEERGVWSGDAKSSAESLPAGPERRTRQRSMARSTRTGNIFWKPESLPGLFADKFLTLLIGGRIKTGEIGVSDDRSLEEEESVGEGDGESCT